MIRRLLPGLLILLTFCMHHNVLSQGHLWGFTMRGGRDGAGVIFKTDIDGSNYSIIKEFDVMYPGENPRHMALTPSANGKLYGLTAAGGMYNHGVLFEYDPATGSYIKKADFENISRGASPIASLIEIANGKLYGMTSFGGINNGGVLFEYDPDRGSFTKKFDFSDETGKQPSGALTLAPNGKLYGMTEQGGNGAGTIFTFDPATDTYEKVLDLEPATTGSKPRGTLTLTSDGLFYGTTQEGGASDDGVLFSLDPATNAFQKKVDFAFTEKGSSPTGSLVEGANGKLYGMAFDGGLHSRNPVNFYGTLFEYDPASGVLEKKIDFDFNTTGVNPYGSLIRASNGKLYGMTSQGGPGNDIFEQSGTLFEYTPESGLISKHQFDWDTGGLPYGAVTELNGKLYGMTFGGGITNKGTLFEFDLETEVYTKKIDLGFAPEGAFPIGGLTLVDGKLFGHTTAGGSSSEGTIFACDTATGEFTKQYEFSMLLDEMTSPAGKMVLAPNGKLYGVTTRSPHDGTGALFEFDPASGAVTKKQEFESNPVWNMTLAANGKLYGLTRYDGADQSGRIFEYDPAQDKFTYVVDFTASVTGGDPAGAFTEVGGKLYGITVRGGANNFGTIYAYDLASQKIEVQYHLVRLNNASQQFYSLTPAPDGKLYGMARAWLDTRLAIIFQFDPAAHTFSVVHEFTRPNGGLPNGGDLTLSPDGALYGVTGYGGANGTGVLFRFNPATKAYAITHDFRTETATDWSQFTYVPAPPPVIMTTEDQAMLARKVYPNPAEDRIYLDKKITDVQEIRAVNGLANTTPLPFAKRNERYEVNVQQLQPGFYILHLSTRSGTQQIKLIKK
jgi:uncharacterized repeat protein (TIGR03803 family)